MLRECPVTPWRARQILPRERLGSVSFPPYSAASEFAQGVSQGRQGVFLTFGALAHLEDSGLPQTGGWQSRGRVHQVVKVRRTTTSGQVVMVPTMTSD